MQFRSNEPSIAFEVLDEDVIVINLDTGTYYSIAGCGAVIWSAIVNGMTVNSIVDRLSAAGTTNRADISAELARFVEELTSEQLIVPVIGDAITSVEQNLIINTTFAPPRLQKFTDMQELLLVDPIHEVSEEGWPIQG